MQHFCYIFFQHAAVVGQMSIEELIRRTSTRGTWISELYWFQKIANAWGGEYTNLSYKHIIYVVISR